MNILFLYLKINQTKVCFRGFDNDLQDKKQPNKPKLSTALMLDRFSINRPRYLNKENDNLCSPNNELLQSKK